GIFRFLAAGGEGAAAASAGYVENPHPGAIEMKYSDVAKTYDKQFKNDVFAQNWESLSGGKPIPIVKELENFIGSGDVLDIGAGLGQNSVYFASRGFNVLAIDISAVAVERIQARATANEISLRTEICDIVDKDFERDFDAIICAGVLHHLYTDDALSVIKKIQRHTKSMGFNIIVTFTKRGDFYTKDPGTKKFYVGSDEDLNGLYSSWTI